MADLPIQSELVRVNKDDFKALLEAGDWLLERLEVSHYKCNPDDLGDCYAEEYGDGTAEEHEQLKRLKALLHRLETGFG